MNDDGVLSERDIITRLLELYKDFPCVWDLSHKDYCNKDVRNQAYSIMLEVLKKLDDAAKQKTLNNKLENMRASYKRERKKVECSKSTGAGTSEVYTPVLWYYQYLTFLDEKLDSSTEAIDNLNEQNKDEPAKKKKRDSSNLRENALLKRQEALIESAQKALSSGEENSADAFGRSISSQLKELPKLQRCLAEKLMGEIFFYAKLDLLNVNTAINLNNDRLSRESINSPSYYARPSRSSPLHPIPTLRHSIPSPRHPSPSPRHPSPSPHHSSPSSHYSIRSPCHSSPSPSPYHSIDLDPSLHDPSSHHSIPSPRHPSPSPRHPSPSPRHPSPSPHHSSSSSHYSIRSPCQPSPPPSPYHSIDLDPSLHDPSSHHSIPSPRHPLPSPHHSSPSPHHPSPHYSIPSTDHPSPSPITVTTLLNPFTMSSITITITVTTSLN